MSDKFNLSKCYKEGEISPRKKLDDVTVNYGIYFTWGSFLILFFILILLSLNFFGLLIALPIVAAFCFPMRKVGIILLNADRIKFSYKNEAFIINNEFVPIHNIVKLEIDRRKFSAWIFSMKVYSVDLELTASGRLFFKVYTSSEIRKLKNFLTLIPDTIEKKFY